MYFRKDVPVDSAFRVPIQDIIHTFGQQELSGDTLKVCYINGLFMTKWMRVKAERAVEKDQTGSNPRARLTIGDYA